MINRDDISILIDKRVGVELSNHDFFRGILKTISENSIILEFFNGKSIVISLESIMFVKVLE